MSGLVLRKKQRLQIFLIANYSKTTLTLVLLQNQNFIANLPSKNKQSLHSNLRSQILNMPRKGGFYIFFQNTLKVFWCIIFTYKNRVTCFTLLPAPVSKLVMIKTISVFCGRPIRRITIDNTLFWNV